MKIHYIRHVAFEGLGSIKDWAKVPENVVTATKFYEDNKLPFVDLFDVLIVMGGPMGVHDEAKFPWMTKEKQLIEKAIQKGKKVIGICLGAQLIADVLGADVKKNQYKEIGWFPLQLNPELKDSKYFSGFADNQTVFHWHGDTFDLPAGATRIASTEGCLNQGFLYQDKVLALQFHMEMTESGIEKLIENCPEDLESGKYVQKKDELIRKDLIIQNNFLIRNMLTKFCE